jgi:GAF domain-containing protein
MAAWFSLLAARAEQSGEILRPNEMTYLCPAASEVAVYSLLQGEPLTTELNDWRAQLEPVRILKRARAFIVAPVYNGGHWVLLIWQRQTGEKLEARYYDSLRPYSQNLSQESTGSAPIGCRDLGRRS